MLQEVHCSENTSDSWTSEWGYKALFSCCSSSKVGVGILFNNNFNLSVIKTLQEVVLSYVFKSTYSPI